MIAHRVHDARIQREPGYLYFIDKDGDVSRARMARCGRKGRRPEKVQKIGLRKEPGWLYYLDKQGNVSRAQMVSTGEEKKPMAKVSKRSKKMDQKYTSKAELQRRTVIKSEYEIVSAAVTTAYYTAERVFNTIVLTLLEKKAAGRLERTAKRKKLTVFDYVVSHILEKK